MAKRLSVMYRKRRRDIQRAHVEGTQAAPHKVAVSRSRKAKLKKAFPMP